MISIEFAIMLLQIISVVCVLLMVITIIYTGEILTREFILQLVGLLISVMIMMVLYLWPSVYLDPTLQVPYVMISLPWFLGLLFGLILPLSTMILLYSRVRRIEKLLAYMNRAIERVNLMFDKCNEVDTEIKSAQSEIDDSFEELNEQEKKIEKIAIARW